jgi:hypothetical protein
MVETLFMDPKEIPDEMSCMDAGKRFDKHAGGNPDPGVRKFEWRCAQSPYVFSAATDDLEARIRLHRRSSGPLPAQLQQHPTGRPAKAAAVIIHVTSLHEPPLRLLLGSDAARIVEQADLARIEADRKWRHLSVSTDFDTNAQRTP